MPSLEVASINIKKCIYLGAIHGAVAWSAYALAEFASSSVLFRLVRPYATFTAWHWQLTALLTVAYLVVGVVLGAFAGLVVGLSKQKLHILQEGDPAIVFEGAALLTLLAAFTANLLAIPHWPSGKLAFLIICAGLATLVVLGMRSARLSERLGLLTNPWVVVGVLLGIGQGVGFYQLQDLGRELGAKNGLWIGLLGLVLVALLAGAIFIGRWLRPRLDRDRFLLISPSWLALVLALVLVAGSFVMGGASTVHAAENPIPGSGDSAQPNVLLVVMDTVRADHLSLYGYSRDTSPNLKKLAADSVSYTHAQAPSDMTLTSHASMFTGLYATWHGAFCQPPDATHGRVLNQGVTTLAESLAARGYSTLGVAANLYLRSDFGLQRGFQSFQIPRPVPILGADESWYFLRISMRKLMSSFVDTAQFDRLFTRGDDVNHELYKVISKQGRAPFFAFVNYMDAHFPYIPPAPYDRLFPGKADKVVQSDLEEAEDRVMHGEALRQADHDHLLSQYDGGIAYTDAQIGNLIAWLKERDLYDNTLIVVTSDHGDAFGEKNLVLHGNSVYQNLLHVALMIKYPKKAAIGVVNDPVSLIDVAPTVLTALGIPVDPKMQGRNLLSNFTEPKRELFSESFPCPVPHPPGCPGSGCTSRAVLAWPYKLVTSSSGKYEVYNVSADPNETVDLSATQESIANQLGTTLKAWVRTMPAQPKQQLKLDGDAVQRLKSLGYVQ